MDLNELFEYLYVTGQVDDCLGLKEEDEDMEEDIDLEEDDYNYTR